MGTERRQWHLSKAVQLPVLVILGGHIFASIWWAATLDAKTTDIVKASMLEMQLKNRDLSIAHNEKRIDDIQKTLSKMDEKLDKLLIKVK